jgi:hypothetical protein
VRGHVIELSTLMFSFKWLTLLCPVSADEGFIIVQSEDDASGYVFTGWSDRCLHNLFSLFASFTLYLRAGLVALTLIVEVNRIYYFFSSDATVFLRLGSELPSLSHSCAAHGFLML